MNKSEVIEFVSKLLKFANEAPVAPVVNNEAPAEDGAALEVMTKDGITLSTTAPKWDNTVEVMVKAEDGTLSPASDNTYELEDGTKITVKGGKVEKIEAIAETPADEVNEDVEEVSEMMSKEVVSIEKFNELEDKFNKMVEATMALTEAFNKIPVSDKIELKPTDSSNEDFGRKPLGKKEKNLREIHDVMEELRTKTKK